MAKAKTAAQLQTELKQANARMAELTEAHEVMVKAAAADKEKAAETIKKQADRIESIKAEAKKQREEKAEVQKKDMKAKLDAEPHHWVQVFYKGLKDGVDFAFNYEGIQFVLNSGVPFYLAESVIKHLKGCGYPTIIEKQGEAGQPIKVHGRHLNFNVVNCEAPEETKKAG